jgi:hypothetical protein
MRIDADWEHPIAISAGGAKVSAWESLMNGVSLLGLAVKTDKTYIALENEAGRIPYDVHMLVLPEGQMAPEEFENGNSRFVRLDRLKEAYERVLEEQKI